MTGNIKERKIRRIIYFSFSGFCWVLLFFCGCAENNAGTFNSGLSLVEIGERSFELGERYEDEGNASPALIAYQRSVWAFKYHEALTGNQPLLLDEAMAGVKRLQLAKNKERYP